MTALAVPASLPGQEATHFAARYQARSGIVNGLSSASVAFATNTLREATFFEGRVGEKFGGPVLLREAMAALYSVVVSDFKYRPRDRVEFFAWLAEQDRKFLAGLATKGEKVRQRVEALEARLGELDARRSQRLRPFHAARRSFFNYVYENEYEKQYLLDPVITVHPDELSFEAFSRDESTYARLAVKHDLFADVRSFECGTTNIDFSAKLHAEMERIRSYRRTHFTIEPTCFALAGGPATGGPSAGAGGDDGGASGLGCHPLLGEQLHIEKKIDLPASWVQGFLQVHSTMSLGLTKITIGPADLFNICRFLRRHKTRRSPRAMRYELTPGKPTRVVLEPWEHVIELSPASRYEGAKAQTIRTWGRDRVQTLGRLIPALRKVDVYLAGFGLPSIYVADLGPILFTLALSGWTDNDWSGGAKFGLLARRLDVGAEDLLKAYQALRAARVAGEGAVAAATGLGIEKARSALSTLCQVGRAMYDLAGGVYRHRDLFLEPFSPQQAAAAARGAEEEASAPARAARAIFESDNVRIIARRPAGEGYKLSGSAKGSDGARVRPVVHIDAAGRIVDATCTCAPIVKHQLTRGPCEHILALRLAHMKRLEGEDAAGGGTPKNDNP